MRLTGALGSTTAHPQNSTFANPIKKIGLQSKINGVKRAVFLPSHHSIELWSNKVIDFVRVALQIFSEKHFPQRIAANEKIWKVVSIKDWNKYHTGTGQKEISGSITLVDVYKPNANQDELIDILGLNYSASDFVQNKNGYFRIETNATDAMATDCRMPFNADVDKTKLGPPQTFSGFAGSENSEYFVPELYLIGDRKPLKAGSIAKEFAKDGKLINEYTLEYKNNIWTWTK